MNKSLKKLSIFLAFFLVLPCFLLASCNQDKTIKLYNTETKTIESINFEDYIAGVVAGEVDNTYPEEALKAQAVLARTFALKFLQSGKSKFEGADISTDISEAQAYDKSKINESIKNAVKKTKGKVIRYNGELINAWFFSNAGGKTATASEGLNSTENYPYIKSVETNESADNTKNYSWTATFSKDEILSALRSMGVSVSSISTFTGGEKGDSGRYITFIVGGKEVNANTFRLTIGSTKLKSTLIDKIDVSSSSVTFSGRGYGHGVGLSQEWAKVLADEGKTYKEIIDFFFEDITV